MRIIAYYLPQYHSFPENDSWWGKGFTEWTNVKKAEKICSDQIQPRIPLNNNYYNLLDEKVMIWQSKIARENGVYGFCFYHYWFNGHMLMEKPIEIYRNINGEKQNYCICWANEDWTRTWAGKSDEVLIAQKKCGKSEWLAHFNYLLPYFKDDKYIKENNKPVMILYKPQLINDLGKMMDYWNQLALNEGFDGICFMYQHYTYFYNPDVYEKKFDYRIEYQPFNIIYQNRGMISLRKKISNKIYEKLPMAIKNTYLRIKESRDKNSGNLLPRCYDYDAIWESIVMNKPYDNRTIPGAFVDFDNTPRKKEKGSYFKGVSPKKFHDYLKKQISQIKQNYSTDYLFLFAWNEWGESSYLEPDEINGYSYLHAIRDALRECGEYDDV